MQSTYPLDVNPNTNPLSNTILADHGASAVWVNASNELVMTNIDYITYYIITY